MTGAPRSLTDSICVTGNCNAGSLARVSLPPSGMPYSPYTCTLTQRSRGPSSSYSMTD